MILLGWIWMPFCNFCSAFNEIDDDKSSCIWISYLSIGSVLGKATHKKLFTLGIGHCSNHWREAPDWIFGPHFTKNYSLQFLLFFIIINKITIITLIIIIYTIIVVVGTLFRHTRKTMFLTSEQACKLGRCNNLSLKASLTDSPTHPLTGEGARWYLI